MNLFDQYFPADLSRMADMRHSLRDGLQRRGVPDVFMERLILVVDEVVTNSIEHGVQYRQSPEPIRVRISRTGEGLVLVVDDVDVPRATVADLARDFDEQGDAAPSLLLERGRGMFLITTFLENLEVLDAEGGGMRLQGRLQESRY